MPDPLSETVRSNHHQPSAAAQSLQHRLLSAALDPMMYYHQRGILMWSDCKTHCVAGVHHPPAQH